MVAQANGALAPRARFHRYSTDAQGTPTAVIATVNYNNPGLNLNATGDIDYVRGVYVALSTNSGLIA